MSTLFAKPTPNTRTARDGAGAIPLLEALTHRCLSTRDKLRLRFIELREQSLVQKLNLLEITYDYNNVEDTYPAAEKLTKRSYENALEVLEKGRAVKVQVLGEEHPKVAESLIYLARLHFFFTMSERAFRSYELKEKAKLETDHAFELAKNILTGSIFGAETTAVAAIQHAGHHLENQFARMCATSINPDMREVFARLYPGPSFGVTVETNANTNYPDEVDSRIGLARLFREIAAREKFGGYWRHNIHLQDTSRVATKAALDLLTPVLARSDRNLLRFRIDHLSDEVVECMRGFAESIHVAGIERHNRDRSDALYRKFCALALPRLTSDLDNRKAAIPHLVDEMYTTEQELSSEQNGAGGPAVRVQVARISILRACVVGTLGNFSDALNQFERALGDGIPPGYYKELFVLDELWAKVADHIQWLDRNRLAQALRIRLVINAAFLAEAPDNEIPSRSTLCWTRYYLLQHLATNFHFMAKNVRERSPWRASFFEAEGKRCENEAAEVRREARS